MNENELAELEVSVQKAVLKLGFTLMDSKNGFTLCAKQSGTLKDKYVAIDIITEDVVSMSSVMNFIDKLSKYHQTLSKGYTFGWSLEGIIYYTGELPENVAAFAESLKDLKLKFSIKKLKGV